MNHLPTEHGQRSFLPKLRYDITDEILAQTNALIYATEKFGEKRSRPQTPATMPGSNGWRGISSDRDQMSANSVRQPKKTQPKAKNG